MKRAFSQFLEILKSKERKILAVVIFSLFISLLLEISFLIVIIPSISIILNENPGESQLTSKIPKEILDSIDSEFIFILLVALVILNIIKFLFSSSQIFIQNFFISKLTANISNRLFDKYLNAPFTFHLKNDSTKLYEKVFIETGQFREFSMSLLSILSEFLLLVSLLILLSIINPLITLLSVIYIFLAMGVYFIIIKGKSFSWGNERLILDGNITQDIIESFNSIKEIIVYKKINFFSDLIKKQNHQKAILNAKQSSIVLFPKYYLEFVLMIGLLFITYIIKKFNYETTEILNIMGFFILSLFKILPSFNKIILSNSVLRFNQSCVDLIHRALNDQDLLISEDQRKLITFNESLNIKNVSYSYEGKKEIIKNFSFQIIKGDKIGLIGKSGSGKSTFLNLIIGFLKPANGTILVDNNRLDNTTIDSWLNFIGYVPQDVLLKNDTIVNNICFNDVNPNLKKIRDILKQVGLESFIKDDLYVNMSVGQNGKKISGGQRQRIGIARALYKDSEILILDEATSSLDSKTETSILESLNKLTSKTILFSTHNKSLLLFANKVINFDEV